MSFLSGLAKGVTGLLSHSGLPIISTAAGIANAALSAGHSAPAAAGFAPVAFPGGAGSPLTTTAYFGTSPAATSPAPITSYGTAASCGTTPVVTRGGLIRMPRPLKQVTRAVQGGRSCTTVKKGTMNPGNARAAMRAIHRIKRARKLLHAIERHLPKVHPRAKPHFGRR